MSRLTVLKFSSMAMVVLIGLISGIIFIGGSMPPCDRLDVRVDTALSDSGSIYSADSWTIWVPNSWALRRSPLGSEFILQQNGGRVVINTQLTSDLQNPDLRPSQYQVTDGKYVRALLTKILNEEIKTAKGNSYIRSTKFSRMSYRSSASTRIVYQDDENTISPVRVTKTTFTDGDRLSRCHPNRTDKNEDAQMSWIMYTRIVEIFQLH